LPVFSAPHSFTSRSISATLSAFDEPGIDSIACATLYCHKHTFLFFGSFVISSR